MNADRRGVDAGEAACARFDAVLPELIGLDGEEPTLSSGEKETLLRHAEACARCADSRRAYRATVDLLRGLPRKSAPSDFLGWVRADLPETAVTSLPGRHPWKWLTLAAAVPLALGAVIYLASLGGDRPAPEIAMAPAPSSRGRSGETAVPPADLRAEIHEPDAPKDRAAALFDEDARSPPAEEVIVLALPYIAGRWESDLSSLEREVRGRFVDSSRNGATPARLATRPSSGSPGGSAAPAEGLEREADGLGPASVEQRRVSEPAGARDAQSTAGAAAAPEAREITVSVDPARVPELRSFVDGWSALRLRKQMRGADQGPGLRIEERLEASPRPPVTIRIRVEPLPPSASPDPKSP